jgi:hypothetical protein
MDEKNYKWLFQSAKIKYAIWVDVVIGDQTQKNESDFLDVPLAEQVGNKQSPRFPKSEEHPNNWPK